MFQPLIAAGPGLVLNDSGSDLGSWWEAPRENNPSMKMMREMKRVDLNALLISQRMSSFLVNSSDFQSQGTRPVALHFTVKLYESTCFLSFHPTKKRVRFKTRGSSR